MNIGSYVFRYSRRLLILSSVAFFEAFLYFMAYTNYSYFLLSILLLPPLINLVILLPRTFHVTEQGIIIGGLFRRTTVPWEQIRRVKWPTICGSLNINYDWTNPANSTHLAWGICTRALIRLGHWLLRPTINIPPIVEDLRTLALTVRDRLIAHSSHAIIKISDIEAHVATRRRLARTFVAKIIAVADLPLLLPIFALITFEAWLSSQVRQYETSVIHISLTHIPTNGRELERYRAPDDSGNNTAVVLESLPKLIKGMSGEPFDYSGGPDYIKCNLDNPLYELPGEHIPMVRKAIEGNEFILPIIKEALGRSESRYTIRYSNGSEERYGYELIYSLDTLAQWLVLRNLLTISDRYPEPDDSLYMLWDIAYSLRNEPTCVGQNIRARIQNRALTAVGHTIRHHSLGDKHRGLIKERIDREISSMDLELVIIGERVLGLQMVDQCLRDAFKSDPVLTGLLFGDHPSRTLLPDILNLEICKSKAAVLDMFGEVLARIGQGKPLIYDARISEPFEMASTKSGFTEVIGSIAAMVMSHGISDYYKMVTRMLIAKTVLMVEDYAGKKGNVPSSLEEVKEYFKTDMPMDPYTSKAMNYRKTETGYIVYSVGKNGKDDGGLISYPSYNGPDIVLEVRHDRRGQR